MKYEFEKKKLYSLLGKSLLADLKGKPVYIAGGTITSLFCNREVNDIDIYFKSEDAFIDFVTDIWEEGGGWVVACTDKATLIKSGKDEYQMIHFNYFPTANDIFDTFDFTVCMGAFDFETEEFHLHPDFMQHNSQRILKFNKNTAYPLVSLLRVQKYKEKGYKISKPEFIRIALTCMNLDINTYEELKEQMGGMYGVNYDKLFKDKEGEVDLEEAIDVIADLVLDDDYFKTPDNIGKEMGSLEDYIDDVTRRDIPYFVLNDDEVYRIYGGKIRESDDEPKRGVLVDPNDYLKGAKYYKFVQKNDKGEYRSFFDKNFEYKIGQEAKAEKTKNQYYMSPSEPVLYFTEWSDIKHSHYKNYDNSVLIEAEIDDIDDFAAKSRDIVTLKRCDVLREVPKDEYVDMLD